MSVRPAPVVVTKGQPPKSSFELQLDLADATVSMETNVRALEAEHEIAMRAMGRDYENALRAQDEKNEAEKRRLAMDFENKKLSLEERLRSSIADCRSTSLQKRESLKRQVEITQNRELRDGDRKAIDFCSRAFERSAEHRQLLAGILCNESHPDFKTLVNFAKRSETLDHFELLIEGRFLGPESAPPHSDELPSEVQTTTLANAHPGFVSPALDAKVAGIFERISILQETLAVERARTPMDDAKVTELEQQLASAHQDRENHSLPE